MVSNVSHNFSGERVTLARNVLCSICYMIKGCVMNAWYQLGNLRGFARGVLAFVLVFSLASYGFSYGASDSGEKSKKNAVATQVKEGSTAAVGKESGKTDGKVMKKVMKKEKVAEKNATTTAKEETGAKTDNQAKESKECSAVVTANDVMQFNTKELKIASGCQTFKITLKHTGKLPRTAMGHKSCDYREI